MNTEKPQSIHNLFLFFLEMCQLIRCCWLSIVSHILVDFDISCFWAAAGWGWESTVAIDIHFFDMSSDMVCISRRGHRQKIKPQNIYILSDGIGHRIINLPENQHHPHSSSHTKKIKQRSSSLEIWLVRIITQKEYHFSRELEFFSSLLIIMKFFVVADSFASCLAHFNCFWINFSARISTGFWRDISWWDFFLSFFISIIFPVFWVEESPLFWIQEFFLRRFYQKITFLFTRKKKSWKI